MNSQEQSIRLIQLYGEFTMLWDPKDPNHLNKTMREDCWRQISAELQCPVIELKKKMDSLLGSNRREKSRERKTHITGSGAEDVYTSKWFGYPYFDFMKNKNEPGATRETMPADQVQRSSQASDAANKDTDTESNINGKRPSLTLQEQHTAEPSASMPIEEPARKKRRNINTPKVHMQPPRDSADTMLEEALQCLKNSSSDINDSYLSFGEHIANELRKYDPHTLAYVKNAINNILFEADLGKYTQQQLYFTQQQYPQSSIPSSHTTTPSPAAATPPPIAFTQSDTHNIDLEDITLLQ